MSEIPDQDPSPMSSGLSGGSPSLADLDALLASASDLAEELAGEVGDPDIAANAMELPSPAPSTTSTVEELDAGLAELDKLVGHATAEVGRVEAVSGDTQVLDAIGAAASPPSEVTPRSEVSGDLDDLTVSQEGVNLDPFGAPTARGAGAPRRAPASLPPSIQPDPIARSSENDPPGETAPVDQSSTALEPEKPKEDCEASSQADPPVPRRPGWVRVAGRGGTVIGEVMASALDVFDLPFRKVPAPVKNLAGWIAVATFCVASGVWLWTLLSHGSLKGQ